MLKHSFALNLHPVSLSFCFTHSHPELFNDVHFLWHARATCVRILKPFVGAGLWLFFCNRCICSSNPCRGAGSKHCLIVGSLGKTLLLFIMSHKTCGLFLYSERERETGGVEGQRESKMRSCFCYYHHVLAGKKCLSAPGLVKWVTSLFLFNFSWESECAPLFSFSRTFKTVVSCAGCHWDKAGWDYEDDCVLRRLRYYHSHSLPFAALPSWRELNAMGRPRQRGGC